jgi:hypothetical protein
MAIQEKAFVVDSKTSRSLGPGGFINEIHRFCCVRISQLIS